MLYHILDSCRCRSCTCDSPVGRSPWKALAVCVSMLVLTCGCQKQPNTTAKDQKPGQFQGVPQDEMSTVRRDWEPWQVQVSPNDKMSPEEQIERQANKEFWT